MKRLACIVLVLAASAPLASAYDAKLKSPAEIAAASEELALKRETCRLEAKEQKLSFRAARAYIKACVKR